MKNANHDSLFRVRVVETFRMIQSSISRHDAKYLDRWTSTPPKELSRAEMWRIALQISDFLYQDDRGLAFRHRFYRSGLSPKVARRRGWVELRTVCRHYVEGWDCECGGGREYLSPSEAERLVACGRLEVYTVDGVRHGQRLNGFGQAVMTW